MVVFHNRISSSLRIRVSRGLNGYGIAHLSFTESLITRNRHRALSSVAAAKSEDTSFGNDKIRQWSLDRLSSVPSNDDHLLLQELVFDVALRLDRQNSIIESLQDVISTEDNQLLDSAHKTLRDLRHLHKDTHRKCSLLLAPMREQENYNTLLLHHIHKSLEEIHVRHSLTMESIAEMVIHVRSQIQDPALFNSSVMSLMRSKIGLQLLADHGSQLAKEEAASHTACKNTSKKNNKNKKGAIGVDVPVFEIIDQASTEAKHLCEAHYLTSPSVVCLKDSQQQQPTMTCVRPWIAYTLVELLKNSMAITAQRKLTNGTSPKHYYVDDDDEKFRLDPIYIEVEENSNEIHIQIFDQGGGTSHDEPLKFQFCQTQKVWDRMDDQQTYAMTRSPLQGLGVGLCMSNLYLQHFGGDLRVANRPGSDDRQKGMTATLIIPKDTKVLERPLDDF